MFPYSFIPGADRLGIGVENMGMQRPSTLPVDSIYAPRYNVRGTLDLHSNAYVKMGQNLVPVSLLANGLYFGGTFELQALSMFEKAQAKKKA